MTAGHQLYADRHGHAWRVDADQSASGVWHLVFTDRDVRLLVELPDGGTAASLPETDLKDLFCDAERELRSEHGLWYVGYRQRPAGRQGRLQRGLCTRFRSAGGEICYSRAMLDFRHMSEGLLLEALAEARSGS